MKAVMRMPAPGLDGTYRGSCVVCLRGTDTGLAFVGEGEWAIAGLMRLGIPRGEASIMVSAATGCDPGKVPIEEVMLPVRVCRQCAAASGTGVTVGVLSSGEVPSYGPKARR